MGNKLGRRRQVVDERYTRPQGLYQHKDVDIKKLRKLILESKLAPCYPGDEECTHDLEECPICFLYYPSLNRSRCCMKGICTECFLQMKVPNSTRPTQCPFCKTSNYAVEYRGVKTKEEKGIEQLEEQRVIEAKIRMRQKEILDEEERMQKRQELSSSSRSMVLGDVECSAAGAPSRRSHVEADEIVTDASCAPSASVHTTSVPRSNREDEFDLDLEDIMVMEAIWRSIQENGKQGLPEYGIESDAPEQYIPSENPYLSRATAASSSSPSGGHACAIAALAERQQTSGESPSSCAVSANENIPTFSDLNMLPSCSNYYHPGGLGVEIHHPDGEWNMERGSELAEAGTSYRSSSSTEQGSGVSDMPQQDEEVEDESFQSLPAPVVPESYEEQMMLAMAVSLADARLVTSGPGVTWH